MPKESIRDESGFAAQVAWSPDEHVQLATLSTDLPAFIAWCRELVERYDAGKDPRSTPHVSDPSQLFDGQLFGIFWTPNRSQLNQLIRNLRRARNAAFGADE